MYRAFVFIMDDNESSKKQQQSKNLDDVYGFDFVEIEAQDKIVKIQKVDATPAFSSLNSEYINSNKFQTVYNTKIAGRLAIALWIMLGSTIVSHLINIHIVNYHMLNLASDEEAEIIEKTNNLLDSQYSGIYAFLGTLTASVTAFYFVSVGNISQKKED